MTPAARIQTAIGILDQIADGVPAEKALSGWARASRYAGSKDRAAVRDHVFDVLRRWRSTASVGGAETGRGRMIGLLRQRDVCPSEFFIGEGYGPEPLTSEESDRSAPPTGAVAWDLPDWIMTQWQESLSELAEPVAMAMRDRADVFLRVNLAKTDMDQAVTSLLEDGIATEPHDLSDTALRVVTNPRRVSQSIAYKTGLVELQDVSSQAVIDQIPLDGCQRILDYCAGGGGKTLAVAARAGDVEIHAHDKDPNRMKDLTARADRAGVRIDQVADPVGLYDLVLCDVPCSGSGAWRRAPEGKWRLTADLLQETCEIQQQILHDCADMVAPGGILAYATCSVLTAENDAQTDAFLDANDQFEEISKRHFDPTLGGDGFYICVLRKMV